MIPHNFAALVEPPYICARVIAQDRNSYLVGTEYGEYRAHLTGAFRYRSPDPGSYPVVGDYVTFSIQAETAIIDSVLPRKNLFGRRGIDGSHVLQPIAANIDTLFVTMALNRDFNLRRLQRYLVAASALEVPFAVALTKSDLIDDCQSFVDEVKQVTNDLAIVVLSAVSGDGIDQLQPFRGENRTIVFVGSSGVGKSTLINRILGSDQFKTNETRSTDDRGRHTTTRRFLVQLQDGTAIIDTPGLREFALADAQGGIDGVFSEVAELAMSCRFRDCKHGSEPGCAVRDSVDEYRLGDWRKLEREAAFETRKHDPRAAAQERAKWKAIAKTSRERYRSRQAGETS